MGASLVIAFGLVLILEGIVPLVFPAMWKETFRRITGLEDGQLRFIGLMAVVAGFAVLLAMHAF
ncbi:MAG: DUF2065 domain-containing protein [Burkholderiaceae bacterium]